MAFKNKTVKIISLIVLIDNATTESLCLNSESFSLKFAANYDISVVQNLPQEIETGIYFGWASIDNGDVHKMVMSIGWNPFFENKHKSMVIKYIRNITSLQWMKVNVHDNFCVYLFFFVLNHFKETHILHKYDRDLYGCLLKVCIVGYLRPEKNFESLDALIVAIKDDIAQADAQLEESQYHKYSINDFWNINGTKIVNGNGHSAECNEHLNNGTHTSDIANGRL